MGTFFKRYEISRDHFYSQTRQFPQLKVSAEGKQKSSGIAEDLKEMDGLLDDPKMDTARLLAAYQNVEKHGRSYVQQISNSPGKGVLDWMKKTKDVSADDEKLLVKSSHEFCAQIFSIIQDVDATVQAVIEKSKSRSQSNLVLKSIQDDARTWNKYVELQGVKIACQSTFSNILLVPATGRPLQEVAAAQEQVQSAAAEWLQLIAAISRIDCSTVLASSTRKSVADMLKILKDMEWSCQRMKTGCASWATTYKQGAAAIDAALKKNADADARERLDKALPVLQKLVPMVEASRDRLNNNLELKLQASVKLLKSLAV